MLSIVIPTYNRLAPLQRCLQSVVSEYYDGLEVIVTDDCSQDATPTYLQQLTAQHPFIKVITNKTNKGVNFSRNRGIELAGKSYILFLDSDDELAPGSLSAVQKNIGENPSIRHFLFMVSDRADEFKDLHESKKVIYENWLSGIVSGDFTHVVQSPIMKQHLFFEEFRAFEHLNWLRVKKISSPQLIVPLMVARRERNRSDSLAGSMKLKSRKAMLLKFRSEMVFYTMYYNDLRLHSPATLSKQLLVAVMLGAACKKKEDCKALIRFAHKPRTRLLANIVLMMPASLLQYSVIRYSGLKGR
jgi:glycosyltransferase involved in cell wall biosynthesis